MVGIEIATRTTQEISPEDFRISGISASFNIIRTRCNQLSKCHLCKVAPEHLHILIWMLAASISILNRKMHRSLANHLSSVLCKVGHKDQAFSKIQGKFSSSNSRTSPQIWKSFFILSEEDLLQLVLNRFIIKVILELRRLKHWTNLTTIKIIKSITLLNKLKNK